ncbi:MAG TPA: hypothetical protein VJR89_28470, partial [Polyangiales bacterium]|nr:hypothetical protein [Polyangiales bacterium]
RIQEAQRDWFLAFASERPLVVLVDGLEHADEGSAAFLVALALAASGASLLLVCALVRERARERSAAVRALVRASRNASLPPLTAAELHALLQSVFGAAEHLSRLSSRLFELTRGNPGHALEVCRQLIERGAIAFESGSWVLSRELDVRSVAASREQALTERLARVTGPARELAQLLAVCAEPLSPGLCRALAKSGGTDLLPQLGDLIAAEVLVQSGTNLQFAHELFRTTLLAELAPESAKPARVALAEHMLANPDADTLERVRAGEQLIAAGDERGPALVARESLQLLVHEVDKLAPATPAIEAALRALRTRGVSPYEEITLLTALALGGYEGERRLVLQYGELAVQTLQELLGLPQARRWRRFLGGTLALGLALGWAAVRFALRRKNPCVPGFEDALHMLFTAVAAVSGAHCIWMDAATTARLAEVLQPFAALGPNHSGGFMYDFCLAIAATSRDEPHAARLRWQELLQRMASLARMARVSAGQQTRLRGGALYGKGSIETNLDGAACLRTADELESNGQQLDRVCADQIRMVYHGQRGELAAYARYRQRAELHAIARGTAWQIETWSPGPESVIAMLLHDALAMKSASEQMRRMSEELPTLVIHARHFRGAYLLLRGRFADAIPWLSDCLREPPASHLAWAHLHGVLARAHNRLGDHASAYAVCKRVHDHYAPENLGFVSLNLIVQTELAIAEAGLGKLSQARERLAQLSAQYGASSNVLLRGELFEAAFEIALSAGELGAARDALAELELLYRPLAIPSLAQHCEQLAKRVDRSAGGVMERPTIAPSGARGSEVSWSIEPVMGGEQLPLEQQAQRALRLLANSARAADGALFLLDGASRPQLAATLDGQAPSALVQHWIEERLNRELQDERTVFETDVADTSAPWNLLQEGSRSHRMLVLWGAEGSVLGIAVLSRDGAVPSTCPKTLVQAMSDDLYEAQSRDRLGRSVVTG